MDLEILIWAIILGCIAVPFFKQQNILMSRTKKIKEIESIRESRVIVLIHRQEHLNFFGLPISRHVNIEDSEQVLRTIKMTPHDMPIDIILHTPGGLVLAAEQIANAIIHHKSKVSVFIPHYAMSGGSMLALAADEIHMDTNAVLGPIDPMLGEYPAASVRKVLEQKERNEIDDRTIILADMAEKAQRQAQAEVFKILKQKKRYGDEKSLELAKILTEGRWTHDYPISCDELSDLGININCSIPHEIYELMELYPQNEQRRPSVQYIPLFHDKLENRTINQ